MVVILVIILIGADRVSDYVAEQAAANTLKSSQHLPDKPDVSIGGFPFLTQLAAGSFDHITVTAHDVPVGQDVRLDLSSVRVVLHDLDVSRSFKRFTAKTATATALVTYRELSAALGVRLGYAGGGRVKASKTVSVAGHSLTATLSAQPRLVDNALSFGAVTVNNLGDLGTAVGKTLAGIFDLSIPLDAIPFNVRVQKLEVGAQGVVVDLIGHHLTYERD